MTANSKQIDLMSAYDPKRKFVTFFVNTKHSTDKIKLVYLTHA